MSAQRQCAAASGLLFVAVLAGCPGAQRQTLRFDLGVPHQRDAEVVTPATAPAVEVHHDPRTLDVDLGNGTIAHLGAELSRANDTPGPAVLIVPGGGDVSRRGVRPGDGVTSYKAPVAVSRAWAEAFARRGALVLAWDKRTCGPNDDAECARNPQDDVDAEGPAALSKDVDAACAAVASEPGFDGRIILFAHAQAAQVALASACAKRAAAIVLIAPIPRAIDEVITAGIRDRERKLTDAAKQAKDDATRDGLRDQANQLKSLAATREAEFAAIKAGKFPKTARVNGATLAYWLGWIALTNNTATLADAVTTKKIVVLGDDDLQYGDKDRLRIQALAPDAFVAVPGADHHLLVGGELTEATVNAVGRALDAALGVPQS